MTHIIDKLHKVEACFGISVTPWVGNPFLLNGMGHGRVSGKDGGSNSLAPSVLISSNDSVTYGQQGGRRRSQAYR